MRQLPICLGALLASALPALAVVHVAPAGADDRPGSPQQPVATLQKAAELARSADRRILAHAGSYYDVSLSLTPEDSGLTIEPAGDGPVTLFGGVLLAGWRKVDGRLWEAKLPAGRDWQVRMLLVNGEMRPRARYPESGTLTHLNRFDVPWMSTTGGGWKRKPTADELTTLTYKPGDLPADLDVRSAEVTLFHMWDESVVGVASHDPATRTLRLAPEAGHPPGAFGVKTYVLWNIPQGLTRPGQWYHDRGAGRIIYWPLEGEDPSRVPVVVPTRTRILRIEGQPGRPAKEIRIRNLAFSVTTTPLVAGGFAAGQFDGAISLRRAESIVLDGITIRGVQGHAVNASSDCAGTRVENCDIAECGAGGIYVGGTSSIVHNNHVRGVGRSYPSAIGIHRGGKNNRVSHNEVHDCPYTAINYGGENNVIEYNLIYDCMKVLHDGAAIYLFAGKNCIVRGNFARDIVDTGGYGASSYYLDERSEGCVVEGNVSLNVARPSHNHMALKNTIRNNVFIVAGDARITFPRCSEFAVEGNVLYATGKIRIDNPAAVTTWSRNLFFSGAGKVEGMALRDYSDAGAGDLAAGDTVCGDPLFVDLKNLDLRYREDSPARKLNLVPIDPSKAGRIP